MSKSGKPGFNPLTAAKAVVNSAVRQVAQGGSSAAAKAGGHQEKPSRPVLVSRVRGISVVGTQERLARLSMRRALSFSAILHTVGPVLLALLVLLIVLIASWLLHFNFWDWFKPKPPQDMTFTLVDDTLAKRPDNPLFKGNANQEAGGKQQHKQPLNPEKTTTSTPPKATKPTPPPKPQPKPVQQAQKPEPPKPQVQPKKSEQKPPEPPVKPAIAKPAKAEKPEPQKSTPTKPKPEAPKAASAVEPVQHTNHSPSVDVSNSSPSKSAVGNPQDGKAKENGVDVAQDVDYGPFMADLQKRISRNWVPPRGMESRKIVLLFYIRHNGQVVRVDVKKSSGDQDADQSAIEAVQVSSPFMALPPQIKEDILPVEFTFDYNVLNPKNAKQAFKW